MLLETLKKVTASKVSSELLGNLASSDSQVRVAAVRSLCSLGLEKSADVLLLLAGHESDLVVLDTLADAVAARQWELAAGKNADALRTWARGWKLASARSAVDSVFTATEVEAVEEDTVVAALALQVNEALANVKACACPGRRCACKFINV